MNRNNLKEPRHEVSITILQFHCLILVLFLYSETTLS